MDLRANLISTKVDASHRTSTQVHASRGQTEAQVQASFQFESTCASVLPEYEQFKLSSFLPIYMDHMLMNNKTSNENYTFLRNMFYLKKSPLLYYSIGFGEEF